MTRALDAALFCKEARNFTRLGMAVERFFAEDQLLINGHFKPPT